MGLRYLFSIGEASGLPEGPTVNRDDIADSFQPIPGFDLEARAEDAYGR
jgi:hypothetical protein